MQIVTTPDRFNVPDVFVDLTRLVGQRIFLKCEGFNFAGSIKLKAAVEMIDHAERAGTLRPGSTIVESSSGNLGVALSMVAVSRGYHFICVTDARCTLTARQIMRTFGAEVYVVTQPHPVDGLVGARVRRVRQLCADNDDYFWPDQYANTANQAAHYTRTGPEILDAFPDLDLLFVGVGTAGTLMGATRYLREHRPSVRVVAIDVVGSVTFGGPNLPRMIPGLGSALPSKQLDVSYVDDVVMVPEVDTVRACWHLARSGFLFGGSTGTVIAGASRWYEEHPEAAGGTAVAIGPDFGERYLDTVYQTQWFTDLYGAEMMDGDHAAPGSTGSERMSA
ncbi:2,3-diaminopropionate biosynthesis protein SbnA [Micromonospora sp. NPDC049044]|uniref:2,3-diaminopropionate biosynthesis protein SbnA n=1 Tax=Micromonospora sp. NPDC049044 TaxID=3154827 RepID=UPI0033FCF3BC